ncbi:ThiF family adenylyltransferase, partial [Agromyces humi]|uniref:ThiF family adenylyltransferase n=1 Tax=Agromyces humi TaxID=1766800 RepID=UPI0013587990
MTATLAFTQAAWDGLRATLDADVETACVLLARSVGDLTGDITLLVRDIVTVPHAAYEIRTGDHLSITSSGWLPAFARADAEECVPLFMHTHPGSRAEHSALDLALDDALARVADVRLARGAYGSFVLGGSSDKPTFAGRLTARGDHWTSLDRVRVVGHRLTLYARDGVAPLPVFDRQVRAFGDEGQKLLGQLRVGVVGAGGTGSAAVEQLVRLGVGSVVVVDPQTLADTNVTRVYGSTLADVSRPKVDIAAEHTASIGLDASIVAVQGSILHQETIMALRHCDVVLGCTDDHAGRLVLTRLPQALLQLLIDCGVVLDSRAGSLFDIFARVSVVTPTTACLVCMGDVDPDKARLEALSDEERQSLIRQGYAPEL